MVDAQQVVLNDKALVNSILKLSEYREWRLGADARGQDCVEHNTLHPSQNVQDATRATGTPIHLDSEPGHHTKMRFVEKVKELVSYIRKAPEFTKADEKMLGFMLYKEMNGH